VTTYRGLDIADPDVTTDEEIARVREYNRLTKGYTPASHEFWLRERPDVFKRMMLMVSAADTDRAGERPLKNLMASLHYYAAVAYAPGVEYQISNARAEGATRGQVVDMLALAYIHGHARGMNTVAKVAQPLLDAWDPGEDSEGEEVVFPEGWSFDPGAFRSGLDFSSPDLSSAEWEKLRSWYERALGEVPPHVAFLAEHRPRLLKAYRNRIENTVRGGLPKEMVPYALLYFDVIRGFGPGIRENVLLARHLGIEHELIVGIVCRAAASYAGLAGVGIVAEAAGDILDRNGATG
jgi:hypothetical protein